MTADDYAAWIVANRDKKGSREFEIVAQAYQEAKAEEARQPAQSGKPAINEAAQETGAFDAALVGAGRTIDRIYKGVKQGVLGGAEKLGSDAAGRELERMKGEEAENTRLYRDLERARPVATFIGETIPALAAIPAAGTVTGAAVAGAVPGALEYGTPSERAGRAAMGAAGGAVGAAAGNVIGRAIQPIRQSTALAGGNRAAEEAAGRLGVKLRPGEVTGSKPLQWLETSLNDLPFSAGMAKTASDARQVAINRAAAKAIGQDAPQLTDDVLAAARQQIGGTLDSIIAPARIKLDNQFIAEVKNVVNSKVMKSLRNEDAEVILAPFRSLPTGPGAAKVAVKGDWFQQNMSALNDAIRSAYIKGEPAKARALEGLEKALDRAALRSLGKEQKAAYEAARKQWANLRTLETGQVVEAGNVVPSRVDAALRNRYREAYKEGRLTGELPDIGRLAQAYKALPQSGTTPRAIYSGFAGGALFAEPFSAGAMLAAPPLAQKFLQSKAGGHYLTKGLAEITPEIEKRLRMAGVGLLGAPAIGAAWQQ